MPRQDREASGVDAIVTTHSGRGRAEESEGWLGQRERGAIWLIRLTSNLVAAVGRRPTRILVRFIACYYVLFDRASRNASRDWLTRVHGRPASLGEIYGHILRFAQVTVDRLLFVRGSAGAFEIERTGTKALEVQAATGQLPRL